MNTSVHRLLVVTVPVDSIDFASDILWSTGAQAVEEITVGDRCDLRTDFGSDPLQRWAEVVATHEAARHWTVRVDTVDASVADTWRAHARPTIVGEFRLLPAWLASEPDAGLWDVVIEPGGSFGIGDHPTTRATLALAQRIPASSVLDLGCGSGVLGIALAKARGSRAVCVDIAPAAVEATKVNARLNGVEHLLVVEAGDITVVRGTYDLVLANILAPVLLADAARIAASVASRGALVTSGFTSTRRTDIVASYTALGLTLTGEHDVDGWLALQFERLEQR